MKYLVGLFVLAVTVLGAYLYVERPEVLERAGSAVVGKADEVSREIQNPVIMMENTITRLEKYIETTHVDIAQAKVTIRHNKSQLDAKKSAYNNALKPYKDTPIPANVAQTLRLKKRTIEMKQDLDARLVSRVTKWEQNEAKAKERLVQQYASLDALRAYMKDIKQVEQMTSINADDLRRITHGDVVDFDSIMNEMEVKVAGADASQEAKSQMVESLRDESVSTDGTATYSELAL